MHEASATLSLKEKSSEAINVTTHRKEDRQWRERLKMSSCRQPRGCLGRPDIHRADRDRDNDLNRLRSRMEKIYHCATAFTYLPIRRLACQGPHFMSLGNDKLRLNESEKWLVLIHGLPQGRDR